MFPKLKFEFTLEPWLSPLTVPKPTFVIPDQLGGDSCWAVATSAVREDYGLAPPPPNSEEAFAMAYWKNAGVVLGATKAWDDQVDDLEPVLKFGQILFGGALIAELGLKADIESWLDQRTYLIVAEPNKGGSHAIVISDWNGDANDPIYYSHDPSYGTKTIENGIKEAFPDDTLFYRTTRAWGAP